MADNIRKRLDLKIKSDLHNKLKVYAVKNNMQMTKVIENLIEKL